MSSTVLPRFLALGRGAVESQLAGVLARCATKRPFVVTDKFIASSGILDRVLAHTGCTPAAVYDETVPDPTSSSVDALAAALAASDADGVLAVGGGSPMDSAKLGLVLRDLGGECRDYKAPVTTDAATSLPLICVPTTAGTGAEATRFAVATDDASGEKMLCAGAAFVPAAAVVDASLADGAPPGLTADVGVDALCHAMEAYVSRKRSPLADGFALDALREIGASLGAAVEDDPRGRDGMAKAALWAGVAFSAASVTLIHGMSRPLGARFHIPHGRANAILAPAVTAFSLAGAPGRYGDVGSCLGLGCDADSFPERLAALVAGLGVPPLRETLDEHGVSEAEFRALLPTMAADALASGSPANNPVVPAAEDLEALYGAIYEGGAGALGAARALGLAKAGAPPVYVPGIGLAPPAEAK
eukprot:CAMPEP_0119285000 /NCGR_PEP_ID=MMETSP1329-20130426/31358_1 /TAXON_ID=114041 /ORGANISM="Genus nov. species nov., Strain RCC1024" /LENGTH=416 /DNA_ID=CAMNT_0007285701 /DNA_START=94 /DNA_END=1341 /DNA_ORIENTATION=+